MPIVTVNLWFDRPVMTEAFVGLPGRTLQWVFDKRIAFGDASHLSLVASGAAIVGQTNSLSALAAREVEASLPGARGISGRSARTVVREKQATFSLAPGQPGRPGTRRRVAACSSSPATGPTRAAGDDRRGGGERQSRGDAV